VFNITETFGRVQVLDQYKYLQEVSCVVAEGQPLLPKNSKVVLYEYDDKKQIFFACPFQEK
jgi:hypothetical protein